MYMIKEFVKTVQVSAYFYIINLFKYIYLHLSLVYTVFISYTLDKCDGL